MNENNNKSENIDFASNLIPINDENNEVPSAPTLESCMVNNQISVPANTINNMNTTRVENPVPNVNQNKPVENQSNDVNKLAQPNPPSTNVNQQQTSTIQETNQSAIENQPQNNIPIQPQPTNEEIIAAQNKIINDSHSKHNDSNTNSVDLGRALVILVILIVIGTAAYFITKPGSTCEENVKIESAARDNDEELLYLLSNNTMYILNNNDDYDIEYLYKTTYLEEITYNICATTSTNTETSFSYFGISEIKNINSIKLYNSKTNKEISAKDFDSLAKELGYYAYGKYTEEVTIVSTSYFDVEMTLKNGNTVEADFDVTGKYASSLVEGQKYTVEFEVSEGTTDLFEYKITAIK